MASTRFLKAPTVLKIDFTMSSKLKTSQLETTVTQPKLDQNVKIEINLKTQNGIKMTDNWHDIDRGLFKGVSSNVGLMQC